MVKIKDNFSYNQNYYSETNKHKFITIHETANTGVGENFIKILLNNSNPLIINLKDKKNLKRS